MVLMSVQGLQSNLLSTEAVRDRIGVQGAGGLLAEFLGGLGPWKR